MSPAADREVRSGPPAAGQAEPSSPSSVPAGPLEPQAQVEVRSPLVAEQFRAEFRQRMTDERLSGAEVARRIGAARSRIPEFLGDGRELSTATMDRLVGALEGHRVVVRVEPDPDWTKRHKP